MILALLSAALLSQLCLNPTGIPRYQEPVCANPNTTNQHIIFIGDSTSQCLAIADGGQWKCLLGADQAAASAQGVETRSSPPSSPAPGRTYFDSTKGCLQTSVGGVWLPASCPISSAPNQPTAPNTLLSPSASTPAGTYPTGTSYYNTTCKTILTYDGASWETCPSNVATAMAQSSNAPTLPPAAANSNKGNVYFDTTLGCVKHTREGLTWGECLTTEKCVSVAVSGLSIPLAGVSTTSTVAMVGARVGASCSVGYPNFMPLNATGVCRVSAAGMIEYRFQSNTGLLSSVIAVPSGTYQFCSEVIW